MEKNNLSAELSSTSYPGRGIIVGKTPDGTRAAIAYFIMGRSENSRNRVFVTEGEGYISDRPADNNADFTQEYLYIERTGCSVVMKSKIGRYTMN